MMESNAKVPEIYAGMVFNKYSCRSNEGMGN